MLFLSILTGCFGEDYDVGIPTSYLQLEAGMQNQQRQLTEANISWSSSSKDVEETVGSIEEFGLAQDEIMVSPNQEASLEFKENEENGGDIWTDPKITATLWRNGEQSDIELNDYREFRFPEREGNYVLEIEFIDSVNRAQYAGNVVIEKTSEHTKVMDEKLPAFTLMEPPSIKKGKATALGNVGFDHSYSEVCWNNCSDKSSYHYPDIHAGDVETGDHILIDWHQMKPPPIEVNLLRIHTERDEVIKKENIDITNTPLEIEVVEENIGAQYALEFLWKKGSKVKGRSVLNFRFK